MHEISCIVADCARMKAGAETSLPKEKLSFFEVYWYFSKEIVSELFSEANCNVQLPDIFLCDASKSVQLENNEMLQKCLRSILPLKHHDLAGIMCDKQDKDYPIHHVLYTWKESHPNPTYSALREALDKYSVFVGRNPLVLAEQLH